VDKTKKKTMIAIFAVIIVVTVVWISIMAINKFFEDSKHYNIAQAFAWKYKITGYESRKDDFEATINILYSAYNKDPKDIYCFILNSYGLFDGNKNPCLEIELTDEEQIHISDLRINNTNKNEIML